MILRYKKNMLLSLFYVLPLIDMLNGYLIRNHKIYGVGSVYHLIFLVVLFISIYGKKNITIGMYEQYCFSLVFVFVFSGIVNCVIIDNFQEISLERVEKIMTTVLTVTCLHRCIETNFISNKKIENLLNYISVVVSIVSLLANITGLGNYTYETSKLGRTGFFTGSNEPIAIYIILNSYLIYKFYKTQKILYLVSFSLFEIDLIFAQSKSAYLYTIVFAIILIGIVINNVVCKGKIKKSILMVGVPGIIAVIIIGRKILINTVAKFWSRQKYIKIAYNDTSFLNYITSGRIERIRFLIGNIFNQNIFVMIFQLLFGQGLNFKYAEILEIDILDVFLYGGLLGGLIILKLMNSLLKEIKKKSYIAAVLTTVIYFYSFTAGHIWTGGISGTYFALVMIFYINN